MPHLLTDEEFQLIEDHMNWRDSEAQLKFQQANLFPVKQPSAYPKVVVRLAFDEGLDWDAAREAAGHAAYKKPNASFEETLQGARDYIEARKVA